MDEAIENMLITLYRTSVWDSEYKYYCPYCLALFKEKVEKCPFCGCKRIKKNDLRGYLRDSLRVR